MVLKDIIMEHKNDELTKEIQDLYLIVDRLSKENAELRKEVDRLTGKVNNLENKIK